MKQEHIFRHIKTVLSGVAVAFVLQIFFTAQAYAAEITEDVETEVSFAEQIEGLRESIAIIGETILAATDVTVLEKVELFQNLLAVAQLLENVEQQSLQSEIVSDVAVESGLEVDEVVTPEDIDLVHIQIELEYDTFEAEVTQYYDDGTTELDEFGEEQIVYTTALTSYTLVPDPEYAEEDFLPQVLHAESETLDLLEVDLGIDRALLVDITNITSFNPARQTLGHFTPVTITDDELLGQIGTVSQINKVDIHFKHSQRINEDRGPDTITPASAAITMYTDQNEAARITITEAGLQNYQTIDQRTFSIINHGLTPAYDLVTELYVLPFHDVDDRVLNLESSISDPWYEGDEDRESPTIFTRGYVTPAYRTTTNNVFEPEIIEFLTGFFRNEDFLDGIDNEMEAFLDFLVNNGGIERVRGDSSGPAYAGECVAESDRVIVDEMIRTSIGFVVGNGDRQVIFPYPVTYYGTPARYEDNEGPTSRSCTNVTVHF